MGKNNWQQQWIKNSDKKNRYKLVKLSVGVVSVLVGQQFLGMNEAVQAEEIIDNVSAIVHETEEEQANEQISSEIGEELQEIVEQESASSEAEIVDSQQLEEQIVEEIVGEDDKIDLDEEIVVSNQHRNTTENTTLTTQFDLGETSTVVDLVPEGERSALFIHNWKTHHGEIEDGASTQLDDVSWEVIDLPHDYSIDKPFSTAYEAESGFLPGGVQWYRKGFIVPEKYQNKKIIIEFEGAYMNAEVYLNGTKIGEHPYGYTSFAFDLSQGLIADGVTENVLAVKTDNRIPSSRWYSGSGIYRDVHIHVTEPLHIDYQGIKIEAPELESQKDSVVQTNVATRVVNESDEAKQIVIVQQLLDDTGIAVTEMTSQTINLASGQQQTVNMTLNVEQPKLWSVETPNLYQVVTQVFDQDDNLIDQAITDYGFRYYSFDRDTGFSLNGEKMKLKGVSMHHDQGALGAVANPAAIERQILILKEMGANAIRSTHNPASPTLIKLANQHGMLVIDEAFDGWTRIKNGNTHDYSRHFKQEIGSENQIIGARSDMTWAEYDVKAMVKSGMNAPSIIMWSIGNEISEGTDERISEFPEISKNLIRWIKEIDTTRPITIGDNRHNDPTINQVLNNVANAGGIIGKNYRNDTLMKGYYNSNPNWILYYSETASAVHSRGYYEHHGRDDNKLLMSAYDNDAATVGWGATASESWRRVIENDFIAGEFVWTGFDYLGEPTPWNGVSPGSPSRQGAKPNSSYFGIVDTAGFPKDTYYLYRSLWNEESDTVHLMPTWNDEHVYKQADGSIKVDVFTNAHRIELYLNGEKIDEQTATEHTTPAGYRYWRFNHNKPYPSFNVQFQPGELSVKAYDKQGNEITNSAVGRKSVKTYSEPAKLKASANRSHITADGRDLVYVEVDVLDQEDNFVGNASNRINFSVKGEGVIVGVDNGQQTDTDSYKGNQRNAFSGKALVIIQATNKEGEIVLTATSEGLESDSVVINSRALQEDGTSDIRDISYKKYYYIRKGDTIQLSEKAEINYFNGLQSEGTINWGENQQRVMDELGTHTFQGTVNDSEVAVEVVVKVYDDIVSAETVSRVIYKNTVPSLPDKVAIYDGQGEVIAYYDVKWDLEGKDFSTPGIVVLNGDVNLPTGQLTTTATIRIADSQESENIAAKTFNPIITNGYKNADGEIVDKGTTAISDRLENLNNGVKVDSANTAERWTNWALRNQDPIAESYVQFSWDKSYTVQQFYLWHFVDNGAAKLPGEGNVWFEVWDDESQSWKDAPHSNITQVSYLEGETIYSFVEPQTTDKIRIWMKARQKGQCIGLTEVEFYTYSAPIEVGSIAEFDEIIVNGQPLSEEVLTQDRHQIESEQPLIVTATAKENGAITLIPLSDGSVKLRVVSEDQLAYKEFMIENTYQAPEDETPTVYYSEDKAVQIELDAKEADDLNAVIHSVDPSVVAHIKEIGSEVDVYEMYFVDSNQQRYSIEHPAKVTVPIHETDSKKFDTIYYVIPATGAYKDLRDNIVKVEKNDGDVTAVSFEVTHFSYYVVSYKTPDEPTPTSPTTSETPTSPTIGEANPTTPPTTGEDKPTPPTTGAVTPPTGETPASPPTGETPVTSSTTSNTSTVGQNEETNSDTNVTSSTESDTDTLASTDDKQETSSEKDDNKVTQDETAPASQPATQTAKTQTTTLPETGEVHDYAIFTSATLAILASVGLIYSKKEEME